MLHAITDILGCRPKAKARHHCGKASGSYLKLNVCSNVSKDDVASFRNINVLEGRSQEEGWRCLHIHHRWSFSGRGLLVVVQFACRRLFYCLD